ncbi:MAG: transglycosylase domain-containing protein [Bacteroidales bacterium]
MGRFWSENRLTITFGQLPQDLINALVATEDACFRTLRYRFKKSFRVLFKTILFNDRSSGRKTITQQLAKNIRVKDYFIFTVILN